jgi:toxin ParE1/3/4
MRARRLTYAAEAMQDLVEIRSYLSKHAGRRVAARMIARIRAAVAAARETPGIGAPRPEYRPHCRFLIELPYVIYYDVAPPVMTVLRILHHARDRESLMGGSS